MKCGHVICGLHYYLSVRSSSYGTPKHERRTGRSLMFSVATVRVSGWAMEGLIRVAGRSCYDKHLAPADPKHSLRLIPGPRQIQARNDRWCITLKSICRAKKVRETRGSIWGCGSHRRSQSLPQKVFARPNKSLWCQVQRQSVGLHINLKSEWEDTLNPRCVLEAKTALRMVFAWAHLRPHLHEVYDRASTK